MLFLSFQSPHNGDDLSEGEGDVGSPDDEMAQKVRNILFVIPVLYELFIQIGIINISHLYFHSILSPRIYISSMYLKNICNIILFLSIFMTK